MGKVVLRMVNLVSMLVLVLARYQLVDDDDAFYNVLSNNNGEASLSSPVHSNPNDIRVVPNWGYRNSQYCLTKCVYECLVTFWELDC